MKRIKIFIVLIVFLLMPNLTKAESKNFLWKIEKDNKVNYVLGSIHALSENEYPLNKTITNKFNESEVVVVEVDITQSDNVKKIQKLVAKKGRFKNKKLEDLLKKETVKKLKETVKSFKIMPWERINQMKPWMAAISLTQLNLMKAGINPNYGVDQHFLSKAKEKKKNIKELESINSQIELLSDFNMDLQIKYLIANLEKVNFKNKFDKMVKAWQSGNSKKLEKIIFKERNKNKELEKLYNEMFDERNKSMAENIKSYFKTNKKHFIIVGAGHLVGETGIINILKNDGFKIEQL